MSDRRQTQIVLDWTVTVPGREILGLTVALGVALIVYGLLGPAGLGVVLLGASAGVWLADRHSWSDRHVF